MVRTLKITNYQGDDLLIDAFNPESSGFAISDIQGITPAKADINFTKITTNDGGLFNSSRIDTRNIVLKLVFLPNPTIEETRLLSYKYFPVKKKVTLEFETDNRKAEIEGYVESNSIKIFSKYEYATISIICPDPYFYSTSKDGEIDVTFSGTEAKFHFPFYSNNNGSPKLVMGDVKSFRARTIAYTGDAEIGMEIMIRALGNVGNITIYNSVTNESLLLDNTKIASMTSSGITTGDQIMISTYKGNKYVTLLRGGVIYNILNCLDKNSDWLQLRRGDNAIAFSATSGATNLFIEIKSKIIYEGL